MFEAPNSRLGDRIVGIFGKKFNVLLVHESTYGGHILKQALESPLVSVYLAHSRADVLTALRGLRRVWHCSVLDLHLPGGASDHLLSGSTELAHTVGIMSDGRPERVAQVTRLGLLDVHNDSLRSIPHLAQNVCRIAPLGLLLRGRRTAHQHVFAHLLDHVVDTPQRWAYETHCSLRTLQAACSECTRFPAFYVLRIYYALRSLLCSVNPCLQTDGYGGWPTGRRSDRALVEECMEFVGGHLDRITRIGL
ncbi:MAG: hypothetical protein GF418_07455 [Chitinivibrionales bacterium]|nr:hypothetical protein [Chitinivibrionales bacterium]